MFPKSLAIILPGTLVKGWKRLIPFLSFILISAVFTCHAILYTFQLETVNNLGKSCKQTTIARIIHLLSLHSWVKCLPDSRLCFFFIWYFVQQTIVHFQHLHFQWIFIEIINNKTYAHSLISFPFPPVMILFSILKILFQLFYIRLNQILILIYIFVYLFIYFYKTCFYSIKICFNIQTIE